ncbi:MAG: hypothetical protein WKF58_00330 [Ilumatobacteraceae bacterium]
MTDGGRAHRGAPSAPRADQPPRTRAGCAGSPDAAQRAGEIALDVEIAGHVRPGEPELAGLPDEVSECSP